MTPARPSPFVRIAHWLAGRHPASYRALQAAERRALHATSRLLDAAAGIELRLAGLQGGLDRLVGQAATVLQPDRAITQLRSGAHLYVDPRDQGCGMNMLSQGAYEEDEIGLLRRLLRPGMTMLDIGANYGYWSVVAAPYLRPGGRILAFEANPHMASLLRASAYLNGLSEAIELHELAVHSEEGRVRFEIDPHGLGGGRIVDASSGPTAGWQTIEVRAARLDDHLPADLNVDVVKIDVEGHEEQVLLGDAGDHRPVGRYPHLHGDDLFLPPHARGP